MGRYYIELNKREETELSVTYEFFSRFGNHEDTGILEVNKKTGAYKVLKELPGDVNNKLEEYACRAILKHWQKGEYPDKTCWAS